MGDNLAYKGAGLTRGANHQAPEIQTMYTLNMPVSAIRTKMRQEFERHRYVSKLRTVDFLIYKSHAEFQVRRPLGTHETQDKDSQEERT